MNDRSRGAAARRPAWFDRLRCVDCRGPLVDEETRLACTACGAEYPVAAGGVPVLMTAADRSEFGVVLAGEPAGRMAARYAVRNRTDAAARLWRALSPPEPVYVNTAAPPVPHSGEGFNIWLGGGGLDTGDFLNVDIAPFPGVDIVANAGRLPFGTGVSDRVACPALLEHVRNAGAVVGEIRRVLKPGGVVEAVVPFCHPYHAFPADYARYSRDGLAELFSEFDEVEIGIRTGPTTTLLAFMTYYGKLLFPVHAANPAVRWGSRLVMGAFGWITAPLVYLDRWLLGHADAHVLANHFWVTARKPAGDKRPSADSRA